MKSRIKIRLFKKRKRKEKKRYFWVLVYYFINKICRRWRSMARGSGEGAVSRVAAVSASVEEA